MFGTLTSRYHFAASYIIMPFTPVLTDADTKRAQLLAELAAKKKAREEEDAAALTALEEQIAKDDAAALRIRRFVVARGDQRHFPGSSWRRRSAASSGSVPLK